MVPTWKTLLIEPSVPPTFGTLNAPRQAILAVERPQAHSQSPIQPLARDAPGMTRTCDTRFRKPLLYPLSYGGRP